MKKLLLIPLALVLLAATYGPPFSVSDLSSLTNRPNPSVTNPSAIVLGGATAYDGLGGIFIYNPTATNAVDNDIYFASTSTGRWVRLTRQIKTVSSPLGLTNGTLTSSASGGSTSIVSGNVVWVEGTPRTNINLVETAFIDWGTVSGTNIEASIKDGSVTLPKLSYINPESLIGYGAGGSAAEVRRITIGANLAFSGDQLYAIIPPGTNSYQISVNGSLVNTPNILDGTYVTALASGTNITFSIPNSGVAAGSYTNPTVTVDAKGRVISIANGSVTSGSGLGTNAFINGVLVQPLRITNSTTVLIYTNSNGDVTFNVNDYDGFFSDLTNALVAGSNVSLSYTSNKVTIAATGGGGGTNGTAVTVDGGADLTRANFADTTGVNVANSGTNVTINLVDRDFGDLTTSSSGTVMTIDNAAVTQGKLATSGTGTSTNFLAGDYTYKQVTTNMIPGLNAILATIGSGSSSLSVNGSTVSTPNLLNSSNVLWNVSGSNITATITNTAGSTTTDVLQWVGSAYFVITNNSTIGDFSTLVTNGVIYAATCVDCQNDTAAVIEFSFPSRSTNYVWTFMPEGNVNGFAAYEAEGYRTTTSLRVKIHELAGSIVFTGGYWMRFDLWDKTSITSGSGGGTSIATNWFVSPTVAGSLTTLNPRAIQSTTTSSWTPDFSAGRVHQATLSGNLTLNTPSNISSDMLGQKFTLIFVQDSTGNRTISPATNYLFGTDITGLTLTTNGSYRDYVDVIVRRTNILDVVGFSRGYQP